MDRPTFVISILSLTSLLLYVIYTLLIVDLVTANVEYTALRNQTETLKKENSLLLTEILIESSLLVVATKAAEQGFVEYEKVYPIW